MENIYFKFENKKAQSRVLEGIVDSFGLSSVWNEIQRADSNMIAQFKSVLTQLLFVDPKLWEATKPVFKEFINRVGVESSKIDEALALLISQINKILGGAL